MVVYVYNKIHLSLIMTWTLDVKEHGEYFQSVAHKTPEFHCPAATWNMLQPPLTRIQRFN